MKHKLFAAFIAAILCTCALSGCADSTVEPPAETTNVITQESTSEIIQTQLQTEPSETAETTTILETPPSLITLDKVATKHFSDLFIMSETEFTYNVKVINENLLCFISCEPSGSDNLTDNSDIIKLRFVSIDSWTLEKEVTISSENYYDIIVGCTDALCKVVTYQYLNDNYNSQYNLTAINKDYSTEYISNYSAVDAAFEMCGHQIANVGLDIIDAENNGAVIVPGYKEDGDENGFYNEANYPRFSIDDSSFVYYISGYERMAGFGIYNFKTGEHKTVPNSNNLYPIGVHNNKIYSSESVWAGVPTGICVTDVNTLETTKLCDVPITLSSYDGIDFYMPEDGSYILMCKPTSISNIDDNTLTPPILYILDPDTAEIQQQFELTGEENKLTYGPYFCGNNIIYCGTDDAVIINME